MAEINVFAWRTAYRGIVADDFLYRKLVVAERAFEIQKTVELKAEHFFVCEENGVLVGFTRFGLSRDGDKPGVPELYAIYVDPGYQRKGFGRNLIRHFLDYSLFAESSETILWVFKDNIESRSFYESMGFEPDGAERMYANLAMAVRYSRKR